MPASPGPQPAAGIPDRRPRLRHRCRPRRRAARGELRPADGRGCSRRHPARDEPATDRQGRGHLQAGPGTEPPADEGEHRRLRDGRRHQRLRTATHRRERQQAGPAPVLPGHRPARPDAGARGRRAHARPDRAREPGPLDHRAARRRGREEHHRGSPARCERPGPAAVSAVRGRAGRPGDLPDGHVRSRPGPGPPRE